MTTVAETHAAAMPGMAAESDVNPDPTRFQERLYPTFTRETTEILGLGERWWEPRDAEDRNKRRPVALPHDLLGYRPLRLWFGMPHTAGRKKDDAWFEVLFSTLYELSEDLCASTFGVDRLVLQPGATAPAQSPWAAADLSPAFIYYAGEIACPDPLDGTRGSSWDALLEDARQRAFVAQGVLAKTLDEHVFSALLFGGTAEQQDALGQWDRIMLKDEGYLRKFKRCEEVQYYLGAEAGGRVLTPFFWAEVARVTAHTAQLLLPLLNLQRALSENASQAPSLPVFYQRLHDVVALAGYASLCMAWSPSIFQVEFPLPGAPWEVDQEREADDYVYARSEAKALAAEAAEAAAAGGGQVGDARYSDSDKRATYIHAAKIKIVLWPRIARLRPFWNSRRTDVRSATQTILTKSHNAYYYGAQLKGGGGSGGRNGSGGNGGHDDDDDEADAAVSERGPLDSHDAADNAADDEAWPELFEYVEIVRTARRRARTLRSMRRLALAWIVVCILAWVAGISFLESMSRAIGVDLERTEAIVSIRKMYTKTLDWATTAADPFLRWPSQILRWN
ncbi:uncharacterized protein SPSK_05170 [Sporothrix schenckii 1099-18]|nr:uncharacterized protein SPSK_05170 [Sporothrix schenckii 1099-18]KJR80846.1 hypothetical protein SPSK_05170 [Sporothrix schenckii 1099-18]